MRQLTCLIAILLALDPFVAARAETPTLSPKEIAAGWVMLFDGSSDYGWTQPAEGAKWTIADGELTPPAGTPSSLVTTTEFGSFDLQGECWIELKKARFQVGHGNPSVGTSFPAYRILLWNPVAGSTLAPSNGKWVPFKVHVEGQLHTFELGGKRVVSQKDFAITRHAITLESDGKSGIRFRNLRLRPLALESIFNGKDLTGWKVVEGHPSVFSVTPEGWLNVTNGNGDIQTERTWGDLVLQIEVFSNGDHLNSGVFFRANPGKFWSGYEDQIRNQWQGDDRNKAVDYGTGGIYNRQPARRVVSSDREWFTMTLVAHGKHIASWVNGYQVADFTDMRQEDQGNARAGARTAPGVLSLQGHDPTTNLNFRNIRVVELPK